MWRIWVSALFWGLNWPAVKIALNGFSPWSIRAVGLSLGAAVLAMTAAALGRSLKIPTGHRTPLFISAFLNIAGFNMFVVFAQLAMPSSRAAILTFTMPMWAALFGAMFAGEKIDRLRALALASGAAGLALLSRPYWPELAKGTIPPGLIYVLGAAILWAAGTVYAKYHRVPADPIGTTAWQMGIAGALAMLGMFAFETPRIDLSSPAVATAFAYHVLLALAVAYFLWFELLQRASSGTAALGTLLIPVFAVTGSVVLLGERPAFTDYAGLALILGGVGADQGLRTLRNRTPH